ncbi:MAG: universal stress protein [Bacteroidales bacterium]|nr:universal stress protein [Bacteroidales bacterium]
MKEKNLQHILVYTDFTEVGDNAVIHAVEIAKIFKKQLTVLHVIDDNTHSLFKNKKTEEKTEQKLNEISEKIKKLFTGEVHTYWEEGCACKIINSTSENLDAVMVVLGVHPKNRIQYITPKYALKKVQKSRVPFLLIPENAKDISVYSKVYLPINHLKETKESANWAAYFGRLNQTEVNFLLPTQSESGVQNNLAYGKKIFKKFELSFSEKEIKCNAIGVYVIAAKFVRTQNDGLLVIMASRKPGFLDKLFGTKELKILNSNNNFPVLTIAPREDLYVPCV